MRKGCSLTEQIFAEILKAEESEKRQGDNLKKTFPCWYDLEPCGTPLAARGMVDLTADSACCHCGRVDMKEIPTLIKVMKIMLKALKEDYALV